MWAEVKHTKRYETERILMPILCYFAERGEVEPLRMDDPFLIRFLRARNYNVERAHRLVSKLNETTLNNYEELNTPTKFSVPAYPLYGFQRR